MLKITYLLGVAALVGGAAVLLLPHQVPMTSKPSRRILDEYANAHKAKAAKVERLWQPVAAAMASGNLDETRRAEATYIAAGEPLGYSRVDLGRFYLAKGDAVDAKAELDHIVNPFESLTSGTIGTQARTIGTIDAEALCLWEAAAVNIPESEKQPVLDRWYENYNYYGLRPSVAFDNMQLKGEALTEYVAGQYCLGNSATYKEALQHFQAAVKLAPTSLAAMKHLVQALRWNGRVQEAKVVAVKASLLTDKPSERKGILWGAHVSASEAKQIAAAAKP